MVSTYSIVYQKGHNASKIPFEWRSCGRYLRERFTKIQLRESGAESVAKVKKAFSANTAKVKPMTGFDAIPQSKQDMSVVYETMTVVLKLLLRYHSQYSSVAWAGCSRRRMMNGRPAEGVVESCSLPEWSVVYSRAAS